MHCSVVFTKLCQCTKWNHPYLSKLCNQVPSLSLSMMEDPYPAENIDRLGDLVFQTSDNSQLLRKVLWINAELTIVWSLKSRGSVHYWLGWKALYYLPSLFTHWFFCSIPCSCHSFLMKNRVDQLSWRFFPFLYLRWLPLGVVRESEKTIHYSKEGPWK